MIKVLKTVSEIKEYRNSLQTDSVGFIPTMGTLHDGHLELIRQSKKNNEVTVVSIFVNPAQFNNRNDFETYPNRLDTDLKALMTLGVDAVITPTEADVYPNGYHYKLTEDKDSMGLCGSARPGHFDGVLTVLIKLFNLVKPLDVYMGLKDYQQYRLVKNMAQDMFLDLTLHGVETVREESGLALSSRNVNLTAEQKKVAEEYAYIFSQDLPLQEIKELLELLDLKIDYLEERWGRKFVAVFIGSVRLIDNRPLTVEAKSEDALEAETLGSSVEKTQISNLKPLNINSVVESRTLKLDSIEVSNESLKKSVSSKSKKILFKMSGSIACFKACDVISKLVQQGHEVKVAVTPDVFEFVGQSTLEGLVGSAVFVDMYKPGEVMSHIHLNDWCDLTVLCPATANTLTKIALGLSDNLITALALSTDTSKPYLIFPAMNRRMLEAKPTQDSLVKIQQTRKKVFFGDSGYLACGHVGVGRLAESVTILEAIQNEFTGTENKVSLSNLEIKNPIDNLKFENSLLPQEKELKVKTKKVLITAGGTSEPIDPVRFVTNTSTGETGLRICEYLSKDYEIHLLAASNMKTKVEAQDGVDHVKYFRSFSDLELLLKKTLGENQFEAIIHLAAVSDYSPAVLHSGNASIPLPTVEKLSSANDFTVEFKKNKKLITEVKEYSSNKKIKVIGFKLLRTDDQNKIQNEIDKILKSSDCVVVNSLENITAKKHFYEIYNLSGLVFQGTNKADMAQDISKILNDEVVL